MCVCTSREARAVGFCGWEGVVLAVLVFARILAACQGVRLWSVLVGAFFE